jgi:pimeloyl-ACP methyl ester carboxylesterase
MACAGGPAAPASNTPSGAAAARFPVAAKGRIDTLVHGHKIGGEEFEDDGDTLTSHLSFAGKKATVALSRSRREVTLEARGKTVVRKIPDGAVALENGCWQEFVVAAEQFPDARTPTDVTVWVPAQDAKVDGTIQVERSPSGERYVTVKIEGLRASVEIGKDGVVSSARVYGQQEIEARVVPADEPSPPPAPWPPAGVAEEAADITRDGATVRGVIDRPSAGGVVPVIVIIAGSGPTDRDGNSTMGIHPDTYKQLAAALAAKGVATLRYDKRAIGASDPVAESSLTLASFVEDARAFVAKLRGDARFSSVSVAGHSEGGLIALELAQSTPVDGLALVAAAGRPFAVILREQLARKLDAATMKDVDRLLGAVRSSGPLENVPKGLEVLFRPSVAPFLKSVLDVDPATLVHTAQAKRMVVLQGDNDLQVTVDDAKLLAADPRAKLAILPGVSHVLKDDPAKTQPQPSYLDPSVPLSAAVVDALVDASKP